MLQLSASSLGLASLGCDRVEDSSHPVPAPAGSRHDVPLRVLWSGAAEGAEAVERAWEGIGGQPLAITQATAAGPDVPSSDAERGVAEHRADADLLLETVGELAQSSDVIVAPLMATAQLVGANAITAWSAEAFEMIEGDAAFLPALRSAARYANEFQLVPLGGRLPALLSVDETEPLTSWAEYDGWVESLGGQAAEPLAPGWAAAMFLWRVATSVQGGWLFERENLEPVLVSDEYIAVLEQLRQTSARYHEPRMGPQQIWRAITAGELGGAVGFPTMAQPSEGAVHCGNLPSTLNVRRILLDPFNPVVFLAAACRQTAVARQFIGWLSGGEGSEMLRGQVPSVTSSRQQAGRNPAGSGTSSGGYQVWLQRQLSTATTLPSLQLLSAGEYYDELDLQVGRCIEGEVNAREALSATATRWREITQRVGLKDQRRAWRRAQGMRG